LSYQFTRQNARAGRTHVETALRASEARYRALYDGTPSMYFTVDPDGTVLSVNHYGATYLGYTIDELVGDSVLRVFVEEDKAKAVEHVAQCLARPGEVFRWELRKVRKNGSRLWVKETARALRAPDGALSVLIVCEDITDTKRAALLGSGQNRVLELIATNAPLEQTLGTLAQLIESQADGMLCSILLLEDDGQHLRHGAAPSLPDGFVRAAERVPVGPCAGSCGTAAYTGQPVIVADIQNDPLWAAWRDLAEAHQLRACWSHPIFSHERRPLGTFAMYYREVRSPSPEETRLVDLAIYIAGIAIERKRAEAALRASEERYRALYHDTPSMYFTIDPAGTVLSVNQFGASYLGYRIDELHGQSVLKVFLEADKAAAVQQVARCVAEPERVFQWELRKVRKDGSQLWVHETARASHSADGTLAVMIVCEDITERKRAEEEIHLRNRAIESTHNAIIIAKSSQDEDNPILYVNPAFERITGYSAAEAIGRNSRFLVGDDWGQPELERLRQAVRTSTEVRVVLRNYRKDGTLFWNEFWFAPVRGEGGAVTHFISVINDVTERVRYERELEQQANYDFLTGLANRNLLRDRLAQTLVQAQRHAWQVAVVFIDLDHFKVINDSMGHSAGDTLVRAVAQRLLGCVREVDTVARLGGDEFVVVLPDVKQEDYVTATMRRIQETLAPPFVVEGRELFVTCSLGAAICPRDGGDGETLLKHADIAMYRAKEIGRNTFQYHRADMNAKVHERLSMETSLRRALEKNEFVLHYQPIMETATGRIVGAEALLRWMHPDAGMVEPARFIPLAEETGLILPIGEWVLEHACRQARDWRGQGRSVFSLAVNLSARQFRQHNLAEVVARALQSNQLEAGRLHLELTESMVMQHIDEAMAMTRRLKALGVSLSLDDFGTGYSSLNYLKRFPIDTIKIDRSFVRDIPGAADNTAIAAAVIAMARSLDVAVVAEGVELAEQFKFLGAKHCDQIQGYYVSPPLAAEAFAQFIDSWPRPPI
jgi:diguanylate cyclase (GGDEF)-like protein/PAS domain S-box-containing protein